jgi:Family of unknown function (DUF5681)
MANGPRECGAEGDACNTGEIQGGRFSKGRSGNPAGKPRGARHRTTLAAEALLDGEAEALTRKAVEMALAGDSTAMRLCLDRILPPRRERPVSFKLPALQSAGDAAGAMAAITNAVASAEITVGEAGGLAQLVEAFVRALEASEFDQWLRALELCKSRGQESRGSKWG